jgi:hypothetical protein
MVLLNFNPRMLLFYYFHFLLYNISRSFSSKRKLHSSIMNNFSLIHKITIHVMKKLKNYLELFLQS